MKPTFRPVTFFLRLSLLLIIICLHAETAVAQSSSPYYWQYRLGSEQYLVIDIDRDGIDEFLVTTVEGQVALLDTNGTTVWEENIAGPILAMTIINQNNRPDIVLATLNRLTFLTARGTIQRQVSLPLLLTATNQPSGDIRQDRLLRYEQNPIRPSQIAPFDHDQDGEDELLLLLPQGELYLVDTEGKTIWQYIEESLSTVDAPAQIHVGDLNGDGQAEIMRGFFNPDNRF